MSVHVQPMGKLPNFSWLLGNYLQLHWEAAHRTGIQGPPRELLAAAAGRSSLCKDMRGSLHAGGDLFALSLRGTSLCRRP